MSQRARGSAINQVSVAASKNVNISINGQLAVQLLAPVYPRPLPTENRQEIDLLKAAHAQISFTGRQALLNDFLKWCSHERALSMRTLVGQGGAGKTRFAYELYARVRKQSGWSAYFLRFLKNEAKEADLWREIKSKNALIIADYASDGARPLADLLRPLADSAPAGRKIRVLLLSRTASWEQGWLAGLSSGRTGEDVDRHFHPREPMELPQFTPEERRAIFQQTMALAAKYMNRPAPLELPLAEFARNDVAERLADPLTLMMAALMTLESGNASFLSLNRTRLAYEVAQKLVADRIKEAVEDHKELFLHMAAYATLCGGLKQEEALKILDEESEHTHLGKVADAKAFLDKLQAWLPGEKTKTWIGVIEPDIVGEAFVLGRLRNAETTVLRAAADKAEPVIQGLVRMAQDFSFFEKDERLEPLVWLTTMLERGEADNNLGLLIDLSNALPESSVVLRRIGLQISKTLCTRLRLLFDVANAEIPTEMQPLFADSLNTLAIRQGAAGQRESALATAEEAVRLFRVLAGRNRKALTHGLARSLNTLANRQSASGQRETALATAEEAAGLFRRMARRNPDLFLSNLAGSLNNLATMQSDAGQRETALTTATEATGLFRKLVERNRDAFLPDLARWLSNLAAIQNAAGEWESALVSAEEAVHLRRESATRNRDAFLPSLAMSLNNLAIMQNVARQRDAALSAAQESTGLYRELAARNRDAFLPELAMSLNNLANTQSAARQRAEALATAKESAGLYRQLARRNRDAFLSKLAGSLNNLAVMQSDAGQQKAGLTTAKEAVRLRRELAARNRDAFLPDLAMSLNNLAGTQSDTGQRKKALATAKESAVLYRELAGRNRVVFAEGLAKACWTLGDILTSLGLYSDAVQAFAEGIHSVMPCVQSHSTAFLDLFVVLLRDYLSSAKAAELEPDAALMHQAKEVLGPYLKKKEGE